MRGVFSRMRETGAWKNWAIGLGLSVVLALLVVLVSYQVPYTYAYDLGTTSTDAVVENFGAAEQGEPAFRWSLDKSIVHFPGIAQNTNYVLRLRLGAGTRGEGAPEAQVRLMANDALIESLTAEPNWQTYSIPIAAETLAGVHQLDLTLDTTTFKPSETMPGSRDKRNLGVMVVSAVLQPNGTTGLPLTLPPLGLDLAAMVCAGLGWSALRLSPASSSPRLMWGLLAGLLVVLALAVAFARVWTILYLWYAAGLLLLALPLLLVAPRWWELARAGNGLDFLHTLGIGNVRVRRVVQVVLVVVIAVGFLWFKMVPLRDQNLGDFISYYAAAGVWLQGNDYYNYQRLQRFNLRHDLVEGLISPFIYPPPTVLFMVPFALLNAADAKLVWLGLNWLLLIGGGVFLYLALRRTMSKPASPIWLALMLAFSGSLENSLEFGQVGALILFLFALGIWAWTMNRPWLSAATAIFGTLLKLFPALLFPYFAWKGDWRTVRASVIGGVGVVAGSLLVTGIGIGAWVTYVTQIIPPLSDVRASLFNQSLNASVRRVLWTLGVSGENPFEGPQSVPIRLVTLALSGALVLVAAWYMRRYRSTAASQRQIEYALIVVLVLLCVPLVWEHYLMWMVLPLFVLLNVLMNRQLSPAAQAGWLAIGAVSYAFTQFAPKIILSTATPPLLDSIGFVGNMLVYAGLVYMLRRGEAAHRVEPSARQAPRASLQVSEPRANGF